MSNVTPRPDYVLGHSSKELERLDRQGADLAGMTRQALQLAGIGPGMRVLDMGTGTGQVARIAAEMVGPEGAVTAVDASPDALAWAVAANNSGAPITYVEGDVSSYTPTKPVDAVLARLVLPYQGDPVRAARHLAELPADRRHPALLGIRHLSRRVGPVGAARRRGRRPDRAGVRRCQSVSVRRPTAGPDPAVGGRHRPPSDRPATLRGTR